MLGILVFSAVAAASTGQPVYLTCSIMENATPTVVDFAVDEAGQRVTIHQTGTGRVVTRSAVFSPTSVNVPDDLSVWTLDRVSLEARRQTTIGDKTWDHKGACKIADTPPKRAF
jgi:hypothetical protein